MRIVLKLVLFFLTTLTLDAKVQVEVDFGERGNVQNIAEKSIKEQFEASMKDFNASKKSVEFQNSIPRVAEASVKLPLCETNNTRDFEPGMTLSKDYFTPDGRVIGKKGDRINPLKNMYNKGLLSKIVVFDAKNHEQITYVKKLCPQREKCNLFISNGNAFDLEINFGIIAAPIPKLLAESLDTKCSLSIYEVIDTHFLVKQISFSTPKK